MNEIEDFAHLAHVNVVIGGSLADQGSSWKSSLCKVG